MENFEKWLRQIAPANWTDVGVRTAKILLIAFIALHLKEYIEAGTLDTPDIFIDSLWVAGTGLVINAILAWARP
jgi:hypothetical protein